MVLSKYVFLKFVIDSIRLWWK